MNLSPEELQQVYQWVDEVPLSRPKRSISRDFADGVMMAEIVHHYFPKLVELHNYPAANGATQKMYNWNTLNQKVFRRLNFQVSKPDLEDVVNAVPGAVERVLRSFMLRLAKIKSRQDASSSSVDGSQSNSLNTSAASPAKSGNQSNSLQMQQNRKMEDDKDATIRELRETVEILELKVKKLEQLVRLKDQKLAALQQRVNTFSS
jgi:hypothetical protein